MRKTVGILSPHQNLSSDTLFHFTDNIKTLLLIIENGFQVRYIYEKLPKVRIGYLVNTVCFCDIPLGAVKYHLNWYGDYGIGISRQFAKELGISPVHYIHSQSPHIIYSKSQSNIERLRQSIITPYLKQIRGKQIFYNEKTKKPYWKWKKFYEEREWRYLSKDSDLHIRKYKTEVELDNERTQLNNTKQLKFIKLEPNKIEYLILERRNEKTDFIKSLRESNKYDESTTDILISKLITSEQIISDF